MTQPKQFVLPPNAKLDKQNQGDKSIEQNNEDKEIQHLLTPFEKYPKLKKWVQLFIDQKNKATYGNRTESAMQAYDCQSRHVASVIGAQNFRKLSGLASLFAEDRGITVEKLITVAATRAITSENPKWFEIFTEMIGIRDPKGTQVLIQNNIQNNAQINVSEEEQKDFNKKFREFLMKHD